MVTMSAIELHHYDTLRFSIKACWPWLAMLDWLERNTTFFMKKWFLLADRQSALPAKGRCVQFGCGHSAPDCWLNYDASPTLRFERLPLIGRLYTHNKQRYPQGVNSGDLLKGLPKLDQSCDGVYASHLLEHLALEDFHKGLRETRPILKPGGRFRLFVPDFAALLRQYVESIYVGNSAESSSFHV
jgi:hypothetical protein